ncbi:MAG: YjbQ family protein [Candidatus Zixiibacteriota bacterium]|nr:MAG: YjbQ family protein [candidate division Zixibacteria bacterium]
MIKTEEIRFGTKGFCDVIDITDAIREKISASGVNSGTVTVFTPSATSGLTTIEYEPGLLKDLPEFFEKILPSDIPYKHDETWHDGNGFSHMRSALIGPDITIPFTDGHLHLGTWQQVVFLDFDNRKRNRRLVLQIIGE